MNVIKEVTLPASQLLPRPDYNPRTRFDPIALKHLANLIQARGGIIQSLIIRKAASPTEYEILAGERRWRAAKLIQDDFPIPCRLVDVDDREALAIALSENDGREDLSPTEEAASAQKYLDMCNGNREEAAAYLGWDVSKMHHRLALMQCTPAVRDALTEKTIRLGHAELLARLAPANQDIALQRIIEHAMSVRDVKSKLADLSQKIESAIFDTSGCAGCMHNSSEQSGLFEESIQEGFCMNPPCFSKKTSDALDIKRQSLLEEVPRVEFVEPKSTVFPIKIVADGPNGIGEMEVNACRSCANFGSTISKFPANLGEVENGMCFDAVCNAKKVASRHQASQTNSIPNIGNESETRSVASDGIQTESSTKGVTPHRVIEYRNKQWRRIAANFIVANPELARKVLIALGLTGNAKCVCQEKFRELFAKLSGNRSDVNSMAEALSRLDSTNVDQYKLLIGVMVASSIAALDLDALIDVMQHLQIPIATYWKISPEFLELLTKSEIEAIADEIGWKASLGDEFISMMKGKKAEVIQRMQAAKDYPFEGRIPTVMRLP